MLRFKVAISIVIAVILAFSANGQVNILSNAINFRQNNANDMQQTTYHYGGLDIYSYYGLYSESSGTDYGTAGGFGAYNSTSNYGIYTSACNGSSHNYGIMSYAYGTDAWAGYFYGNVIVTGEFSNPSDEKFKLNVVSLDSCLVKVMALKPKSYNYDTATYKGMGFSGKKTFGLIAQEVAPVLPTLVIDNAASQLVVDQKGKPIGKKDITYKSITYMELIPLLIGAIQEQQAEIIALKAKLGN